MAPTPAVGSASLSPSADGRQREMPPRASTANYSSAVISRNVAPSRWMRPATGSATCVPMISVSESANRSMRCALEARACLASKSDAPQSGYAIWQGWCITSPAISADCPRDSIITLA
jgi:hypothetical protein